MDRYRAIDRALAWLAGKRQEYDRLVAWDSATGAWLRTTAASLPREEPADPVLKRLFDAPLYVSVNGALLSIRQLDETAKFAAQLPVSRRLFPGMHLDPPVVWCPWPGDPVVEGRFSGRAQWHEDVTSFRAVKPFGVR